MGVVEGGNDVRRAARPWERDATQKSSMPARPWEIPPITQAPATQSALHPEHNGSQDEEDHRLIGNSVQHAGSASVPMQPVTHAAANMTVAHPAESPDSGPGSSIAHPAESEDIPQQRQQSQQPPPQQLPAVAPAHPAEVQS